MPWLFQGIWDGITHPEVSSWVLLMCWGSNSTSSAFGFYHLVCWCIWGDRDQVKIPGGVKYSCLFTQVCQRSRQQETLDLLVLGLLCANISVLFAHLAEECIFPVNPSCSRRLSRLEPSYSATHTCPMAHWTCILYERNLFPTLCNSKTASPQRNEKAGLQIHYDRSARPLLSEAGGESNSFCQAEVVRKLVCTLLDKYLGSWLLGTSRKHLLLLGIKRSSLLFPHPTCLFSVRAFLDRSQALLCWEGLF